MKFDRIFSNDLIEHLRFPVEELRFMRGLLKEDGAMYHATGCYEYAFEYTRFHLFFFTGRSLRLLAEKKRIEGHSYRSDLSGKIIFAICNFYYQ